MHICNDPKWLLNPVDLNDIEFHRLADEKIVKIESFGDVYLKFDQGSFIIWKVSCVMKLSMSVISMAKLHEEGYKIFFDDHVTIMRKNITICVGREQQGLYELLPKAMGPRVDKSTIRELEQMISKMKED